MQYPMIKVTTLVPATSSVAAPALVGGGVAGVATPGHVIEKMRLVSGKMDGKSEWPNITNFDDRPAPLMGQFMKYATVMSTTNGQDLVNGRRVANVPDIDIAHAFTVVGLGFNSPIPVAPTSGHTVVTATFVANKVVTLVRHCYAPCGGGSNGMSGATSFMNWMTGKIKVTA